VGGKEQVLAIAGSNVRGTIFGVYDFEQKHLGVDPLWFWADHEPATRGELIFDDSIDFGPSKEPTWKYRGWTLNDHPQFMEWMQSGLVQRTRYSRYMFAIHPEVFERLWEAALRLKMNMFTWYFVDIDWQPDRERLQAAVDRGLFITQHQMEGRGRRHGLLGQLLGAAQSRGQAEGVLLPLHPEAFREFWSHYIRRWAEFLAAGRVGNQPARLGRRPLRGSRACPTAAPRSSARRSSARPWPIRRNWSASSTRTPTWR
jgi:hypothetical protein